MPLNNDALRLLDRCFDNSERIQDYYQEHIKYFTSLAILLNIKLNDIRIASYHISRSCTLPVPIIKFHKGFIILRANFYNIKIAVVSSYPVDIPYEFAHKETSIKELEEIKRQAEEYNKCKYDSTNEDWYEKYTRNYILRKNGRIFIAHNVHECYCEGINKIKELPVNMYSIYETGKSIFTVNVTSYPEATMLLHKIDENIQETHYRFVKAQRQIIAE